MHEPPVLLLNAMAVAATAPLVSVLPCTRAHSPTFAEALVVFPVVVYVVFAVTVIVPVPVVLPVFVLSVIVEARTEVTWPLSRPPKARRAPEGAPLGALLGRWALLGRPLGAVPAGRRRAPNPAVQVPPLAGVIRTDVAVMAFGDDPDDDPDDEPDDAAAEVATTHEPGVTAASVVFFSSVKLVAEV